LSVAILSHSLRPGQDKKMSCAGLREEQAGVRSRQPQWRLVALSGHGAMVCRLCAFGAKRDGWSIKGAVWSIA